MLRVQLSMFMSMYVQGKNEEAWSQSWMVLSTIDRFCAIYLCW